MTPTVTTARPRDALRSFLGVPFEPRTYRTLAYNLLAVPLGLFYVVVLVTGAALTVGLGVTLAGPFVLVVTLLLVATLAWADGRLTGVLLDADVDPEFPGGEDALGFLVELALGRGTWVGLVYLLWRAALGPVVFVTLVVGAAVAASLLAAPLGYGEHFVVQYGYGTVAIDSLGRALVAALGGAVAALVTLHLSNLLGDVSAAVASALLDPE